MSDSSSEKIDLAEPHSSTSSHSDTTTTRPTWRATKRFRITFSLVCFAFLLSAFESSVVGNVLPSVASSLDLGNAYIWCSIAFLLSAAIVQPFYAQLQDVLGRKLPLLAAIFIFAIGSACCGAANGKATMITGRVIQGLGTSGIDLIGETIVGDLVPLRFRPKWFGIKQAIFAAGTLLGPVLGGVFTEKLSWRYVFYMNIPMCAIIGVLVSFALKLEQPNEQRFIDRLKRMKEMDLYGILILGTTLVLGTVSLSVSHPLGTPGAQLLFAAFCVHLIAFIAYQTLVSRDPKRAEKLFMSGRLFKRPRTALIGLWNVCIWGCVAYGVQLILPIYLQAVRGNEPMQSGYKMLPITALLVVCSWASGHVLSMLGNRAGACKWMQAIGFAFITLGVGLMIPLSTTSHDGLLFSSMVICAIGSGVAIPAILPSIIVELDDADNAIATGNWAFLRSVGAVIGCLLPALCLNYQTGSIVGEIHDNGTRERLLKNGLWNEASAEFMQKLPVEDRAPIQEMFTHGLRSTFVAFTVGAALALLVTLAMKAVPMRDYNDTEFGLEEGGDTSEA